MAEDRKLSALHAVLRVAARHPYLLEEDAFVDLAAAIGGLAPGGRLSVLVPDGPLSLRVYAMSPGPETAVGFGARIPGVQPDWQVLFVEGRQLTCDDLRVGNPIERANARDGALSYVAVPCRLAEPRPRAVGRDLSIQAPAGALRVVAVLVISFPAVGQQKVADVDALQEVADAIGPALERAAHLAREHRLAMILETSWDAMLAWDREGRVTDANTAAEVLTGRARADLLGVSIADLLEPPPRPGTTGCTEGSARYTLRASTRRVTVAATVTAVEHDALVSAHALLRDLSNVVAAEREAAAHLARIHELEEQHRTLLDNAPLIIFRLDPATRELVYLNRHAERLLGVPTAEALATPGFLRAAHADPEGVAAFDAAVERAALGSSSPAHAGDLQTPGPAGYEARLSRRGGAALSARGNVYPLVAEGGRVAAIEGVLADVSAEHAARTRLVQADRLSTLGTLAAGVAHEINNPAAFILLGLDLLDRQLEGPDGRMPGAHLGSARETLRELRDSIRRIVDIARDLRLFASTTPEGEGRRAVVDVNAAVESALSLTRGQIIERARVEQRLEEVPPVLMDEGRLGQVMVNLLVNAAQAIPRSHAGDQRVTVATRSDGHVVEIEVVDTGAGISAETMPRIWQPFFTTKSPEVGTGLGLSISRAIVERAGGTITAESPASGSEGGARFVIRLPAAGSVAGAAQAPGLAGLAGGGPQTASPAGRLDPARPNPGSRPDAGEASHAARRARVLVVEDEPALARALAEEIGTHHDVAVALGAEAALATLARERFDAVLCDLRMPGMSGEVLYGRVRERDAAQAEAFVFMTGVGFGAELTRFLAESGRPVLEKPFPASRALEAIARRMSRG